MSAKKLLITGGAGFLGINTIRYFLDRGWSVASLDIADFTFADVIDRIEVIDGDIRDPELLDKVLKGVDVVVHSAAALPLASREDIYTTEVDGTRNVLAASLQNKVERVIHISSTAVYGIPDHHPLVEGDRLHGVGPYGEGKVLAEAEVVEFRKKGLCVPVLRPKSFVGPERLGVFALLYDWAYDGRSFPMLGDGKNLYQLLDVEDLCDAIYLCVTLPPDKANDTFNIGAKEFRSLSDDFQSVLDHAGHGKRIRHFPARPVVMGLKVLEKLRLSPLYEWIYETAYTESFVSTEKAESTLGWRPKFSNKDALIRNYDWYRAHVSEFKGKSGTSHTVPWDQGALRLAKIFF